MLAPQSFICNARRSLGSALASLGIVATPLAMAVESPYALAADEFTEYCIAEVCLGTTIERVSTQGKLAFSGLVLPEGKVSCSDYLGNRAVGDLIATDGRIFEVAFTLVSTTGKAKSRYRLTSVTMKLPKLSELQIDHLRETLTSRYGLRKYEGTEMPNLWLGETKSRQFSISVQKWWARPETPPDVFERVKGLGLAANYVRHKEWLMSQPECRAGLPKV